MLTTGDSSFFFAICSDSNDSGPDKCCSAQEVGQGSIKFYPDWCVSRLSPCLKVLVVWTVLQQVLYCHWRCSPGVYCRMTSMELGGDVMSESVVTCPQSHNDHLVFSRKDKEVVCIQSVVVRILLKPPSPLPLFHHGFCFLKHDIM